MQGRRVREKEKRIIEPLKLAERRPSFLSSQCCKSFDLHQISVLPLTLPLMASLSPWGFHPPDVRHDRHPKRAVKLYEFSGSLILFNNLKDRQTWFSICNFAMISKCHQILRNTCILEYYFLLLDHPRYNQHDNSCSPA